jgi:Ca2+-binding EF-hand superfamily protein
MKSKTKFIAGLAAATVLGAGFLGGVALTEAKAHQASRGSDRAHAMHANWDGPRGHMDRGQFSRRAAYRHGAMGERLLEQFDTDKDGKLTQEEVDKFRAGQLAEFDADKDGKLNLEEYQALWLDVMRERMVDAFQRHDGDGDALVTLEEFQKRFRNLVARLDRDDDGAFSRDDHRNHREKMRHRRGESDGPRERDL